MAYIRIPRRQKGGDYAYRYPQRLKGNHPRNQTSLKGVRMGIDQRGGFLGKSLASCYAPLSQDMLVLPGGQRYFDWKQRPTLLADAIARQGWRVHWVNPLRFDPEPGEHKEKNVLFWRNEDLGEFQPSDNFLSWVVSPLFRRGSGGVNPGGLWVFDYMDDFPEHRRFAEEAIRESDITFCTADVLLDRAMKIKKKDVFLLPNGVEYDLYESEKRDSEGPYAGIPHPRIGYMGALAYWIDWELIEQLAMRNPDWSIVLIGFFYGIKEVPFKRKYPNVFLAGYVDYHNLPLYLKGLDVGIIPFVEGPIADACNPCKLYQYWAAGLPVVSTPLKEVGKYSSPLVYVSSRDRVENNIDRALSERNPALCREEAKENTWDKRAEKALSILDEYYLQRGTLAARTTTPTIIPKGKTREIKILLGNNSPLLAGGVGPTLEKLGYRTTSTSWGNWEVDTPTPLEKNLEQFRPDIVFLDSVFIPKAEWQDLSKSMQKMGIRFIYWMVEDPLTAVNPGMYRTYNDIAAMADLILTCASESLSLHRKRFSVPCEPFLFAFGLEGFEQLRKEAPYRGGTPDPADVVLIANHYDYFPDRIKQQKMILSLADEFGIKIYGSGWEKMPGIDRRVTHAPYTLTPAIYDPAKIVLGVHSVTNSVSQTSMRSYEVMGNGSFYLTYNTLAHKNLFREGYNYEGFESEDELRRKLYKYLEDERARNLIAERAREDILSNHTYAHRWRVVEKYLEEWFPPGRG